MQTADSTMGRDEPARLGADAASLRRNRPVLLYSGSCRFCRWAARIVAAVDRERHLSILPLADHEAGELLEAVPEARRAESWWIVRPDGAPVAGKRGAGILLMTEIRLTRPFGRALDAIGLSRLVDVLDAVIARHRGRLSRLVPDGPAPRRYP